MPCLMLVHCESRYLTSQFTPFPCLQRSLDGFWHCLQYAWYLWWQSRHSCLTKELLARLYTYFDTYAYVLGLLFIVSIRDYCSASPQRENKRTSWKARLGQEPQQNTGLVCKKHHQNKVAQEAFIKTLKVCICFICQKHLLPLQRH